MNFRDFVTEVTNKPPYPVARGVQPPPGGVPAKRGVARQLTPQQGDPRQQQQGDPRQQQQQQLMRITQGQFTPEETQIVNKQKAEMQRYGVVFTPFKFYGGMQNPQSSLVNPAYQGKPDLTQFQFNR